MGLEFKDMECLMEKTVIEYGLFKGAFKSFAEISLCALRKS
jgi:hypothetical protein